MGNQNLDKRLRSAYNELRQGYHPKQFREVYLDGIIAVTKEDRRNAGKAEGRRTADFPGRRGNAGNKNADV